MKIPLNTTRRTTNYFVSIFILKQSIWKTNPLFKFASAITALEFVGYSQEILKKINSNDGDVYEDFHVGISNLKKRVELIYKSGFSFAFYNEPDGGACSLIYLPADNNER